MLRPVKSGPAAHTETGPENVRREDRCDPQPMDYVYGEPNSGKCYIAVRSGIGYPKDATRVYLEDLTVDGKLTKDPNLQCCDGERRVVYLPWCVWNATRTVQHPQTPQIEKLWKAVRPSDTSQGGPRAGGERAKHPVRVRVEAERVVRLGKCRRETERVGGNGSVQRGQPAWGVAVWHNRAVARLGEHHREALNGEEGVSVLGSIQFRCRSRCWSATELRQFRIYRLIPRLPGIPRNPEQN